MTPPRRALFVSAVWALVTTPARGVEFERVVIDDNLPGAYQVEVADVNGDGKPDVVALGGGTVAWYENPSWRKRVVTGPKQTPGVISTATADLDGDGKAEVAVAYEFAMNAPKTGKLLLASQGKTLDDPWTVTPVADVGSIHRLRWGEFDGDFRTPELVVAPIFGPAAKPPSYADPARLGVFLTGPAPKSGRWTRVDVTSQGRPVLHAVEVSAADPKVRPHGARSHILTADNDGVTRFVPTVRGGEPGVTGWVKSPLVAGAEGDAPKRGCSEVHLGKRSDGRFFLATVEPWHGSEVAVYASAEPRSVGAFGPRTVIDTTLDEGHALWVADVDGDGDDEIFAGHRGKDHRVSVYDRNAKTGAWDRTVLDRDIAAQDLRGGDLDGDGTPDVVAVGGSTHNVVWYRPVRKPR